MKIEQLKTEVNDIATSLNQLKDNVKLSEEEKKKQAEALKTKVDQTKKKIDARIKELSDKTDADSKKEVEEGKQLLETLENVVNLQSEIIEGKKVPAKSGTGTPGGGVITGDAGGSSGAKAGEGEKGIIGKSWDWVKEQWNETTWENLKEKPGATLLRGACFAATGIGAAALAYKGLKKLFGRGKNKEEENENENEDEETETKSKKKKKKEKKEKKPFWDRWYGKALKWTGIGTAAYYVAHGIKTKKWNIKDIFDWYAEGEKPLSIEESLSVAEGEVNCGKIDENLYRQNFDSGIKYDKESQSISSYGESTQVDEKNKCIVGLSEVKFKTNTELVHAANIVNCLKYNLKGKGGAAKPFAETETGGDIAFCFSGDGVNEIISGSNSDFWKNFLTAAGVAIGAAIGIGTENVKVGIGGAIGLGAAGRIGGDAIDNNSSLGKCCSTIKDGANFSRFIGYLNELKVGGESLRLPGKQELEPESKSPMQKYINESITEIEESNRLDAHKGKSRDLKAEQDPKNPNRYKITSYGQSTYITMDGTIENDKDGAIKPSSIKSITVEQYTKNDLGGELKLNFPHTAEGLKECIKVIDLTNMTRQNYAGKGGEEYPVFYNQKDYFAGDAHTALPNSTYEAGLRIDTNGDVTSSNKGMRLMTNEDLGKYYPTLLEDLKKSRSNSQDYFEGQLSGKSSRPGSSYIKFLNGMRTESSQNYWTWGQKA